MSYRNLRVMKIFVVLLFASGAALHAQDIAGDWQGTLDAGQKLRIILQIEKAEGGVLKATAYSIDQSPNPCGHHLADGPDAEVQRAGASRIL
jgi:hypothetical protein